MEQYKLLERPRAVQLPGSWGPQSDPLAYVYLTPEPHFLQYFNFNVPIQVAAPVVPTDGLLSAIGVVHNEITEIRESLTRHQKLLEEILTAVRGNTTEIEIEDVDDDEARARIQALFKESKTSLFYDDIAERLRLPLRQTVEICNQLEMEGLIGEARK